MQPCLESNTWGTWLKDRIDLLGVSRNSVANEYRDLVDAELPERDGRGKVRRKNCDETLADVAAGRRKTARKKAYPPKSALSLMVNGERVCGPAAAWRWGVALSQLSEPSSASGLEALLAAGHRKEALGLVGLALKRYFVDCYDRRDPESCRSLSAALVAVADCAVTSPVTLLAEECWKTLALFSKQLTTLWHKWFASQDPSILWPNYHAAYVILSKDNCTIDDISLARTILTYKGYDFGAADFVEEGFADDAARMLLADGDSGPIRWLHHERFEQTRVGEMSPYDVAACALLAEHQTDVSLVREVLSAREHAADISEIDAES